MAGGAVLKYVMLLQRDVPKAVRFYNEGLGLQVNCATERWAELQSGQTKLALKAADGCVFRIACWLGETKLQPLSYCSLVADVKTF